jgi:hypothetical protein
MPHNLSRERNLPEPLKIRTDWFNPSIAHRQFPQVIPEGRGPVIPEGRGPVKTNFCVVLVRSASFLVLVGRVEVGVGSRLGRKPDRVAAVGP